MSHAHPVATVAGTPIPETEVDAGEARLRSGPLASALPASGTSEGRQLRRWLTQLIVTERVVATEAAARGLAEVSAVTSQAVPPEAELLPDVTARLEIGSVAAAALAGLAAPDNGNAATNRSNTLRLCGAGAAM